MSNPTPWTSAIALAEIAAQAIEDGDVDQEIESLWAALSELGITLGKEPGTVVADGAVWGERHG